MTKPSKTKTPATVATEAGAGLDTSILRQSRYPMGAKSAMGYDMDSDTPQQVMAYVSRGFIYQVVDDSLNVVAYGGLTRREVRS